MAYLRLTSPTNDNWAARDNDNPPPETWGQRRYGVMPPPRRPLGGNILLGMIAMPLGVWGLWLLMGSEPVEPAPRPLVFQVPPPETPLAVAAADARRGLKIVLSTDSRPVAHPETWGALPTAAGAPVVATPLADASPPEDAAGCRDAPTLAAQMTCVDPTLREAEQRMGAAYEAVLAAGVSPAALGRSQARWLATRDVMAQSSPEDLLVAYQQRESQLRSFAVALELRAGSVGQRNATSEAPPPVGEAIAQRSVGGA
ncbi:hypothetical protein ASD38_03655 [Caulobacter sp. Root487D2Y]|uniref:DUF1311 domain-containing protein n=1 Tax=Caulobacter sp. Root487D2Y TaxID=1736547 RepID=UPI000700B1CE|nr:DUF1311 domain-containing protein [Caulobacter sp. Root487D2Y]KQY35664.1 hypothetical protein ASD38_03655 [Caulobacter sp. Root487D2Y]